MCTSVHAQSVPVLVVVVAVAAAAVAVEAVPAYLVVMSGSICTHKKDVL
jgi:hypothetical protein